MSERALVPDLTDAREKLEDWRKYYNEDRPHGAIGNKPPASLATPAGASNTAGVTKTGKLYLPAVNGQVADQIPTPDSRYGWMRNGGQVII